MYESFSAIAGLPATRRAAALDAVREVLQSHRIGEVALIYRTVVATARRR